MLLTDLFRWPELSHRRACRNALRGTLAAAQHRRDVEDADRFVEEVLRQRAAV
jgi:hypothetical protein